jgi:hypothetical protein
MSDKTPISDDAERQKSAERAKNAEKVKGTRPDTNAKSASAPTAKGSSQPAPSPEPKSAPTPEPKPAPASTAGEGWFVAHDFPVWIAAVVLLVGGWIAHATLNKPGVKAFDRHGLTFTYPSSWLAADPGGDDALPLATSYASLAGGQTRVEVRITAKPGFDGPIGSLLDANRAMRYAGMYKRMDIGTTLVRGRSWSRAEYIYAYKPTADDAPQVASAVEYGIVNGDKLYAVSVHGPKDRVDRLERDILGTLALK